jgi:transposase InsO family protein
LGRQRRKRPALTLRALDMALKRRCPDAGLLHHSDQGCTYASEDYRTRLEQHGIACSMIRDYIHKAEISAPGRTRRA